MAWGKKRDYKPNFDVVENCGAIEERENSNWGVALTRISWSGKPPAYDIRDFELTTIDNPKEQVKMGKGVTLWDDESMDRLTHLLVDLGFGNTEDLRDQIDERESFYTPSKKKKKKARKVNVRYAY